MSRRLSWVIALMIIVVSGAFLGLLSGGSSAEQSPVPVPASAESTRADQLRADFPGGDQAPALMVLTRADGAALSPADQAAADAARQRMLATADAGPGGPPLQVSEDGQAAIAVVPLPADLSGFALGDEVTK